MVIANMQCRVLHAVQDTRNRKCEEQAMSMWQTPAKFWRSEWKSRVLQGCILDHEATSALCGFKTMIIWYVHRKLIAFLIMKLPTRCADVPL